MTDRSTRLTAVLAAIVAVLAVVAVFVTSYRGGGTDEGENSTDARGSDQRVGGEPAPAGPADDDAAEPPPDEGGDAAHPEAPDPEVVSEIQQTTVRFLRAWAEPGNADARAEAIEPYATRALTQQLSNVDPANLPTFELDGDPRVEGGVQSTATADATFTEGLQVRCELVLGPDGWMVSRLLPLEQEQQPQRGQQDERPDQQDGRPNQQGGQQGETRHDADQGNESQGNGGS